MAITGYLYDNFPHLLLEDGLEGSILSQTIHVALLTTAYTPNRSTHIYFNTSGVLDMTTVEAADSTGDYAHLGSALGTKTCTNSAHVTTFDAANTVWTATTIPNARYAVVFYNKTGDTDHTASLLIGYIDFGEQKTTVAGDFTITWNVSGIFTITCS